MLSKDTLQAARQELQRHRWNPFLALTTKGAKALNEVVEAAEAAQKDNFLFRVAVEYDVDVVVTLKDPPQTDGLKTDGLNACCDMMLPELEASYKYEPRPVRVIAEARHTLPCSVDLAETNRVGELPVNDQFGITVRKMQKDAYENAKVHGFHGEDEVDFGTAIALIHSEASEALEAHRKIEPFIKKAVEKVGSQDVPYDHILRQAKEFQKLAVASELADVLIRCGDTAQMIGADLDKAVRDKMAFNKGRPFKHGGKAY